MTTSTEDIDGGWTSGTTWSLKTHAIRPSTTRESRIYVGRIQWTAACNANIQVYSTELPHHVAQAIQDETVTLCKRCVKIAEKEAGRPLSELPTRQEP